MEANRHRRALLATVGIPLHQIDERFITIGNALLDVLLSVQISAAAANGYSFVRNANTLSSQRD